MDVSQFFKNRTRQKPRWPLGGGGGGFKKLNFLENNVIFCFIVSRTIAFYYVLMLPLKLVKYATPLH